jgi:hypothetical protein
MGGQSSPGFLPDLGMEPALQVIKDHHEKAKKEIERLKCEIDQRHENLKALNFAQDQAVKQLRDRQTECLAYVKVLHRLRGGGIGYINA